MRSDQKSKYRAPTRPSLDGPAFTSQSPTEGQMSIRIVGDFFGPAGNEGISVYYGPLGNTKKYEALDCRVLPGENQVHKVVSCKTSIGVGKELFWTIIVGDQESPMSTNSTAYAAPAISGLAGAAASQDGSTTEGGTVMQLQGTNFGPSGTPVSAVYGPAGDNSKYTAQSCQVLGHTSIECETVEGTGRGLQWSVTAGGQSSATFTGESMTYADPVVDSVKGIPLMRTDGTSSLIITGRNFGGLCIDCVTGKYGGPSGTKYGPVDCSVTTAHKEIRCGTAAGVGVTIGG